MKTTIDIPESLYRQAKIRAVETGKTFREILLEALNRSLNPSLEQTKRETKKTLHFEIGKLGIPLLKRRPNDKTVITNEFLNRLREREGV